ncbi:MAG: hypothetical protein J0I41_03405 [Filimonas sp.]|nr:hypothetical protein [Filimonas sp.]
MILFHAFKHHLHTIVAWLDEHRYQWNIDVKLQIMSFGNSQLDFYMGNLSVQDIKGEVLKRLEEENIAEKKDYESWVNDNGGYRTVMLSDGSEWTLRYVIQADYVHIHPARYAKHTIRVKANALKTCVCFLLLNKEAIVFSNEMINYYRGRFLQLPPVNLNETHAEMEAVYKMLIAASRPVDNL